MKKFLPFILLSSCLLTAIQGFGLITNKGEPLELLELKTKAFIKGPYAEIRRLCTYKNSFNETVKTQFFFPQAENAILGKFEIKLQNQTIPAEVVEKDQAKTIYLLNAKESTILEDFKLNKVDKDILDIKIGEIPSNGTVQIEFSLLQPLDIIINKFFGLKLPPVLKNKEWTVEVELASDSPLNFTDNPSHQVKPQISDYITAGNLRVYKAFWYAKIDTSRDFIVYFRPEKMQDPRFILAAHPTYKEDYMLLLDFVPELNKVDLKKAQSGLSNDDLLKVRTLALEDDILNAQGEFLFVIDRSNSMRGARIENLKKALIKFLLVLPKNAYFNIISFGSTFSLYQPQSVKNTLETLEEATKWVYTLEADMGETEILGALEHLFGPNYTQKDDLRTVFLLTDGGVFNANQVVWLVRRFSDKARFCTVGIGSTASRYLVNGIAEAGNCKSEFVADGEDIGDKAIYLVKSAISQYISRIRFKIMCFSAKDELLHHEENVWKRLLKDQPFRKWVYLPGIQNLESCHATLSYDSSLKGEKLVEEFDISGFGVAEKTDIWHKLAIGSQTDIAQKLKMDYDRDGLVDPSRKYQVLSENTCLLGKTRENNFETEVSMKKIYLTDLSPADYDEHELTAFHRLFVLALSYIQAVSNFINGIYNYFQGIFERSVALFVYYFNWLKIGDITTVVIKFIMFLLSNIVYVFICLLGIVIYQSCLKRSKDAEMEAENGAEEEEEEEEVKEVRKRKTES